QPAPPAAPGQDYEDRTLSRMRAGIARNIGLSKPGIPHIYLTVDVETDALLALRKQLNEAVGDDARSRISVNDLVVRAAALALRAYPDMNAWFVDEPPPRVRVFRRINVGIAVSVEGGLLVPVLRDVDAKSLGALAREAKDAYERVKANKPRPDEYAGGTFTVSNLGQWGIDEFQAVINPPQAGILAVGAAAPKAVVRDGQVVVRSVMRATISADHRVVDGVYAAEFIQEFKRLIEAPFGLVI
ncbi:MAG TPA: dihydrolipoamide acetyltransferase family protein, partial [Chloroflexota bacterium]|nr:dihydrolipoamide acetyltransferase family protein [Chloroflexota bacterium]